MTRQSSLMSSLVGFFTIGLVSFFFTFLDVAQAKQYLYVDCASLPSESTSSNTSIFSGHIISEDGPQFHDSHISIRGKKPVISTRLITNANCKSNYINVEEVWSSGARDWVEVEVRKSRNWNAFAVKESNTNSYLGCSVVSSIETFDTQEDFLRDMYKRKNWSIMKVYYFSVTPTSEGGIGHPSCIVNEL